MTFSYEIKPLHIGIGVVVFIALVAGLVIWYKPSDPPLSSTQYAEVPAQTPLSALPKVEVPATKIKVIPKKPAVHAIPGLPPEVVADTNIEITSTATTGPCKGGLDIVSTFNKGTGDTKILVKEKPRSLIEFVNEKRIGVGYGVTTDKGQQFVKVFGEWTPLRVGNIHVGVQTDVKSKQSGSVEGTAQAVVDYRW